MKKILATCVTALAMLGMCLAETVYTPDQPDHLISYTTNATNVGILSYTNSTYEPWEFSSLWLKTPSLTTNSMSVSLVRRFDVSAQYQHDSVETNFAGQIVTNNYNTITNFVSKTITNALITLQATNMLTAYADEEISAVKIPNGLYVLPGDILNFSFVYTNEVTFGFTGVR